MPYHEQLLVIVTDLYLAWQEDPLLCLGMPFSQGAWDSQSRYKPLKLSKQVIELVKRLQAARLVRVSTGSHAREGNGQGNRTTRIQAAHALQQHFEAIDGDAGHVWLGPSECIILKEGKGESSRSIEYEDTDEINRMRDELSIYNDLLGKTFIDIPTLEEACIYRDDPRGGRIRVGIGPRYQQVRRIFSRGSWTMNGRFYGPWWQGLGSGLREQIFINDTPTVEIDFKAMHLHILAAQSGEAVPEDPYLLPPGQFPGVKQEEQRGLVKLLVLMALNAKDVPSACAAFREGLERGHPGKRLKNEELVKVLDAVKGEIPWLSDSLCSDAGIRLMYTDSLIIERVIGQCTALGRPVLTVHDSVIAPYTFSRMVKDTMTQAALEVVGRELPLEAKYPGFDDWDDCPPYVQQDFRNWRETERCRGYLARLEAWERTTGMVVHPFPA